MMRKILFLLIVSFVSTAVTAALIIQTDWFWKAAFPKCFNRAVSGVVIKELNYDQKTIQIAGEWSFKNIKVVVQADRIYKIDAAEMVLKDVWRAIYSQGQKVVLKVFGFSVQADDMKVRQCLVDVNLDIQHLELKDIGGHVSCGEIFWAENLFSAVKGDIKGGSSWLALENIAMNYRQGKISGRMTFGLNDVFPYVLDFDFQDVFLDQDVFDGNVLGRVSGTFQANGFSKRLNGFEMVIDAPQGSKIKADLLQSIVPYLPAKSSVKKDLEAVIKIGGYVYFEISHAVIRKMNDNAAFADVSLRTKKLNLILNPTIDINIEGGLQSIFNVLEFFSNPQGHQEAL